MEIKYRYARVARNYTWEKLYRRKEKYERDKLKLEKKEEQMEKDKERIEFLLSKGVNLFGRLATKYRNWEVKEKNLKKAQKRIEKEGIILRILEQEMRHRDKIKGNSRYLVESLEDKNSE